MSLPKFTFKQQQILDMLVKEHIQFLCCKNTKANRQKALVDVLANIRQRKAKEEHNDLYEDGTQ